MLRSFVRLTTIDIAFELIVGETVTPIRSCSISNAAVDQLRAGFIPMETTTVNELAKRLSELLKILLQTHLFAGCNDNNS